MTRRGRVLVLVTLFALVGVVAARAATRDGAPVFPRAVPSASSPGATASSSPSTTTATTTTTTTTTRPLAPRPGSGGAGDPLFRDLGNGGYDVSGYDLDVQADPARPGIEASATIRARAVQDLASFHLDLHGLEVTGVMVDGRDAVYARENDELVITPPAPVAEDRVFTTLVRYRGVPEPLPDPDVGRVGWIHDGATIYVASEPQGAHTWFPANDHPADKATFRIAITVPSGVTAVSGGLLTSRDDTPTTTRFVWDMVEPTAPYLVSLAIGDFTLTSATGPHGIIVRNAFAASLAPAADRATARVPEMIAVLESLFGPYPFSAYGALVIDTRLGFALENQTLSLFDRNISVAGPSSERIQVHELAHQWFGDSVSLARWGDIWLNEGFATYAESLWLERTQPGFDIDAAMRAVAAGGFGPIGSPPRNDLFDRGVYERGALTLHALRRTVGDDAFFATLQRYATTYRHANATTADFIAIAEHASGHSLTDFFQRWLFDEQQPALP